MLQDVWADNYPFGSLLYYLCIMKLKDESKNMAIKQATLDVVLEKGLTGVKMASIAGMVEISVSTLYVYYKSKEELITSLYLDIFTKRLELSKKESATNEPFKIRLKRKWLSSVNFGINNRKELNFIRQIKQSIYYGDILKQIKHEKQHLFDLIFEEGKKNLLIKDVDTKILIAVFMASVEQTVALILNKDLPLKPKNTDLMFSFFWDSIKS